MLSTCLVENDQDPQDPPGQAASRGFQQRIDAGNAAAHGALLHRAHAIALATTATHRAVGPVLRCL